MSKKYLLLLLIIFSLSCISKDKNEMYDFDKMQRSIGEAYNSPVTETMLFLDFRFGMSQQEVLNHIENLKQNGKIYLDENGAYSYNFNTGSQTLKTTFQAKYNNDSLYQMDFAFKSQLNNGSLEVALVVSTFTKTNKEGYKSYIIEHSKEDTEYAFIKNNLIIRFDAIRGARMSYTNGPIAKKIEDRTRKEGDKKNIDTISDF